ncbi:MAG: prepilin-type N-terminal cleavage/methylation domain-containing protein [Sedimentisphaerales bacterium]|nr:prepilin-type N-terminal cleavage/methylation domain-containing protein [Sedimentisphaerales bacterium]
MKTKATYHKGFSLIELMVAIAAGAVLILAAGIVVYLGQISWNDAWNKVNLHRDASYAMLAMSQYIKKAKSVINVDGPILTLTVVDTNDVVFSFDADANDLLCVVGGNTQTILDGKVRNLQFDVNVPDKTVNIDLELKENNVEIQFESTVLMRNAGG